jgi:hypothetical protein
METFYFIQATTCHNLRDPHSKALEPDCLSPFAYDYDTVSGERGGWGNLSQKNAVAFVSQNLPSSARAIIIFSISFVPS